VNRYLLDTNMASFAMNGHPRAVRRMNQHWGDELCLSALTEGELLHGLHKRGRPPALAARVEDFVAQLTVLPWRSEEARIYGALKANHNRTGKPLAIIDLLLAAHALAADAVLVSDDRVFGQVPELRWENWLA
jgi:tRNA(fMet)-specific endonuclease VapC